MRSRVPIHRNRSRGLAASRLSLQLIDRIMYVTRGRPLQRAPLAEVTVRMDKAAAVRAVSVAEARGWIEVEGGHSVVLTDTGRRTAKG